MASTESVSLVAQIGQYSWCITVVGVCLGLIGWRVAYNNSVKLATRSESKSIIDAISKLVIEISDISSGFWLNQISQPKIRASKHRLLRLQKDRTKSSVSYLLTILAKAQQVSKLICILESRGLHIPDGLLSSVLEKATLDCEAAHKLSDAERPVKAQEVIDACMGVIEALHTSFQRYHPPKKDSTLMQRLKIWFQTVDDWHNDLK
ncbi:hypothetical protein [Citrobacter werkmanii]|uniref:hypothetical protein n=1 Tax=Citrobacter werkmanii TaxID=67827 RepID=UPI0009A24C63|nr:hypothetical protein [Citrobacter werkmanii]